MHGWWYKIAYSRRTTLKLIFQIQLLMNINNYLFYHNQILFLIQINYRWYCIDSYTPFNNHHHSQVYEYDTDWVECKFLSVIVVGTCRRHNGEFWHNCMQYVNSWIVDYSFFLKIKMHVNHAVKFHVSLKKCYLKIIVYLWMIMNELFPCILIMSSA